MKIASKLFLGFIIIAFSGGITGYVGYTAVVNIIELDDPEKLESEIDKTLGTIVLLSTTSILLALCMGFIISSSIAIPLKKLESFAKEITEGNLDAKITHKKNDELGKLSDTFNLMINSLKKNADIEKELAQEKLKKERMVAIGHLSASIAHDIRNPLYAIKNSIQVIKKRVSDEIGKQEVQRMNRSVARINHQISQVLDFVRQTPIRLDSYSLNHVLKGIIDSLDVPKNITITTPAKNYEILIDRSKMESAIYNILFNAIQAISSSKGNISITTYDTNDHIKIEIANDGPLIQDTVLPNIFEPLFTTKQTGTGLGLSSAKNTIEQHKGTISVKNNPVTFIINIPKESNTPNA